MVHPRTGRSETDDGTPIGLLFAGGAPIDQDRSVVRLKGLGAGAPSADWQGSGHSSRAALSLSPSDTEGAKGAKVGHLAQGKHLPPL